MLQLETALERILARVHPLECQTIPLQDSIGRFLAEPVEASIDLPVFDNSAMDGYAVRASDTVTASPERPVLLRLQGRIPAGEVPVAALEPSACVRVFTGSPMPAGADAVVMQEDTGPAGDDKIRILDRIRPWENVRLRGEDVRRGSILATKGQPVAAANIGVLAATGVAHVVVRRRPIVGLLATGSELLEPGAPLRPGHIYESNRLMLRALLEPIGAQTTVFPIVADDLATTQDRLAEALRQCDVVVTSGGVSVGEFDHVKEVIARLGGEVDFWRVAIKPGKPFAFGTCGEKLVFGLPGNPVSAFVTFLLLVRPAILSMQGANATGMAVESGILGEALENPGDRRHFVRVRVDSLGTVTSAGVQASHALGTLGHSNALVDLAPGARMNAGEKVRLLRW